MTSQTFIWYDGEYWKFKNQTINAYLFQNKNGDSRRFKRWQVAQGLRDYQKNWPKEKTKN